MNEEAIMKVKLTQEQLETMSYTDVAFLILNTFGKKMKIQDLFKKVAKAMGLSEAEFNDGLGDFFEAVIIDKRFIMLENGFCDLKINHSSKITIEEDEEEEIDLGEDEEEVETEVVNNEVNYDDEDKVEDDSEDELEDLVIITDDEEDREME